jgi:[NiFe] hydrogenase assembly HybE family chaperone
MAMTANTSRALPCKPPRYQPVATAAPSSAVALSAQAQGQAARIRLAERVRELQALFEHIAATRMAGVALLNDDLRVQTIGFELDRPVASAALQGATTPSNQPPLKTDAELNGDESAVASPRPNAGAEPAGAVGILITPWFMNLVWMPLDPAAPTVRVGDKRTRVVGNERFDFIGAHEPGFGGYEACSLFSPMFEFVDHGAAVATAFEVLKQLRAPKAESTNQASQTSEADHWASIMSPGQTDRAHADDTAAPAGGAADTTAAGRVASCTKPATPATATAGDQALGAASSSSVPGLTESTVAPSGSTSCAAVPSRRALLFGRTATGAPAP